MRHNKKFNHLGRKPAHRKAMLANMAASLIVYKRIKTTVAKAKALRMYVEPLITKSKNDTTHSRRVIFSYLKDKEAVNELFREIANKIAERPGGYLRILKTGNRLGDNAEMCFIEFVDYNETYSETSKDAKPKTRRSRRSGGAKTTEDSPGAVKEEMIQTEDKPEDLESEEKVEKQVEEKAVADVNEVIPEPAKKETDKAIMEKKVVKTKAKTEDLKKDKKEEKPEKPEKSSKEKKAKDQEDKPEETEAKEDKKEEDKKDIKEETKKDIKENTKE